MKKETEKVIRDSVKSFFANKPEISKYRVSKIIKAELEDPCSWLAGHEYDNSEDACVRRYYENIKWGNVLANWLSHLHVRYNVYYNSMIHEWRDANSKH